MLKNDLKAFTGAGFRKKRHITQMTKRGSLIDDKEFDEKDLGANPFIAGDFKIIVRKVLDHERLKNDEGIWVPTEDEFEQEKFVKVYTGNKKLKKEENVGVEGLNALATQLFFHILFKLENGNHYVFINKKKYMQDKGISSVNTYKKGLNDLILRGVLAPVTAAGFRGYYFINPRFFFSGSRVNKYPERVVEYGRIKK